MIPTRSRTLLLVDGSDDDRLLLLRLLRDAGDSFDVIEARSGAEGLRLARSANPDIILLDHYLPDLTGSEFLEDLGATSGGGAKAPVAVLTRQENPDVAVEVLENGAVDYLVKGTLTGPGLTRAIEKGIQRFAIQREVEGEHRLTDVAALVLRAVGGGRHPESAAP